MKIKLNGYKTYIGASLGVASVVVPILGVPAVVAKGVAIAGAVMVVYGRKHASSKIAKAFAEGRDLAQVVKK